MPTTGTYDIVAYGAQGGNAASGAGGLGAEIGGDVSLTAGETLQIAVGGAGVAGTNSLESGGDGGSLVVGPGNAPLVIAGGGGGGISAAGGAGLSGPAGSTGGNGGGAGGGFLSAGTNAPRPGGYGGQSFKGGFGGGTGAYSAKGGAGAGAGALSGGGGGSFDSGTNQVLVAGENSGNGSVVITALDLPPVVVNESFSTNYGSTLTLAQAQLLAGDSDPQGEALKVIAVSGGGAVLNPDGTVSFTAPGTPVTGNTASFGFTVADTDGNKNTATATIGLTAAVVASVITVPAADQTQSSSGLTPVTRSRA